MKNSEIEFNFGQAPFKYLPTSGGYEAILSAPINNTTQSGAETGAGTTKVRNPTTLILEPTRELAEQTHNAISSFMKYMPPPQIGQVLVVGGISAGPQTEALKKGTDIVTGTPGRIIDLIQSGTLVLADIRFFVLDEADKFLESDALR
jgi:ATP-dependent RNA helicase DDX1